jgi:hypothetical protein
VIAEASISWNHTLGHGKIVFVILATRTPLRTAAGSALSVKKKKPRTTHGNGPRATPKRPYHRYFTVGRSMPLEMDEDLELKHRRQEKYKERLRKEIKREIKKYDEDQAFHTQGSVYIAYDWDPELGWVPAKGDIK